MKNVLLLVVGATFLLFSCNGGSDTSETEISSKNIEEAETTEVVIEETVTAQEIESVNDKKETEKGLGIIVPVNSCSACGWGIFVPKEGIKLFNNSNRNEKALLTKSVEGVNYEENGYNLYLIKDNHSSGVEASITCIGVEKDYLTYFEEKDGFVRIKVSNENYWVKISSLETKSFRAINWQIFYTEWSDKLLQLFCENELNIREQPSTNAKIIRAIKGDFFEISIINEHSGNWSKVVVKKYKIRVCEEGHEESLEYEAEGWIKVMDDNGYPLLNFYGAC